MRSRLVLGGFIKAERLHSHRRSSLARGMATRLVDHIAALADMVAQSSGVSVREKKAAALLDSST